MTDVTAHVPDASPSITIPADRNGPPRSANGGYACGLMAAPVRAQVVTTTLRKPPPLGRPLRATEDDSGLRWSDGDVLIAETRTGDLSDLEVPTAPSWDRVTDAMQAFDVGAFTTAHPFPTCFTCGPARPADDGLGLYPAPVGGGGVVAWTWIPASSLAGDDELVTAPHVWAALDCPGGWAVWQDDAIHLLGSLTAQVHRRPAPSERLVVTGWPRGRDGRKGYAGSAVWTDRGERIATAKATWISVPASPVTGSAG